VSAVVADVLHDADDAWTHVAAPGIVKAQVAIDWLPIAEQLQPRIG
jgi:hypothetical protein